VTAASIDHQPSDHRPSIDRRDGRDDRNPPYAGFPRKKFRKKSDASRPAAARPCSAGRDGFWLARWLRTRGVEAYAIHPTSIAVSREHRRAKTDRLDTELGLARAGNARVCAGMIQLAWRFFSGSRKAAPWLNGFKTERSTGAVRRARR
jgi:hypothetical protein